MDKIAKSLASLFGLGYLKPMPGTYASLMVFAGGYFLKPYFNFVTGLTLLLALLVLAFIAIDFTIKNLADKDPSWIVIDEALGVILILLFIPDILAYFILALVIFRILDAGKIWPLNLLNKIKTPFGVIVDDLAAGLITILLVKLFYWWGIF